MIAAGDHLWIPTRSEAIDRSGLPTMDALKQVSISSETVTTVATPTSRLDVNGLAVADGAVWVADNRRGHLYRISSE